VNVLVTPRPEPIYRIAQPTDLPAVAQVFAAAFPDSVAHVVVPLQSPRAWP
jgi:hypothetical protein